MSNHTIAQSWFRLLQTIGNPADLSRPTTISRTPKFLQAALSDPNHRLVDPSNHPCLNVLPYNFYVAIRGIASLVDAFLGKNLLYLVSLISYYYTWCKEKIFKQHILDYVNININAHFFQIRHCFSSYYYLG